MLGAGLTRIAPMPELRVLYTAGQGNAFAAFADWAAGQADQSVSHVPYSRQLFEAVARAGASALVTCSHAAGEEASARGIEIRRRPDLAAGTSGLGYHLAQGRKARQVIRDAQDFGATVVILSEDSSPDLYAPLRRCGVRIVQALHTQLLQAGRPPSFLQRRRLAGYGRAYAAGDTAVLSASNAISAQVEQLAGNRRAPIREFLPYYLPDHYGGLPPPDLAAPELDILFVGRVEPEKGVLDLLPIAQDLAARGTRARFHICGIGSALEPMQQQVASSGQEAAFRFHGWCDRAALRRVMAGCQLSIVPSRATLSEGFNQVVIESILGGRPALVSTSCPAIQYVDRAVVAVPAGDLAAFARDLHRLDADRAALGRLAAACAGQSQRFTDPACSLGAALDEVLQAAAEGRPVIDRRIPPQPDQG